jgi:hypothetical protein
MLKRISGLAMALTLLIAPFAEAGSFSGGSSTTTSKPSTTSSSTNLSKPTSTSSTKTSGSTSGGFSGGSSTKTTTSSTTPSSGTTSGSVKGSFSGGSSTTSPSIPSTTTKSPVSTGYQQSNVTSRPTYSTNQPYVDGRRSYSWTSPATFGAGLASGVLVSSLFHPWGYHSGTMVTTGGYYQPSYVPMFVDLILLIVFGLVVFWIVRKIMKGRK